MVPARYAVPHSEYGVYFASLSIYDDSPPPFIAISCKSAAYSHKEGRVICIYRPPFGYITKYCAITCDDGGRNLVTVYYGI